MVLDGNNNNNNNKSYKWWVLAIVMVGSFMGVLDNSIVNVALPHFMVAFGANTEEVEWVVTAYMLAFAILMPLAVWLRNLLGLKVAFLVELAFFVVGSFLCSLSWSLDSLIVFRLIQAIGAGDIMPTGMTMISEVFPKEERGFALGMWGMGITVAPAIGPTLGGYLLDHVSWHALFYINIPIGVLAFFWGLSILRPAKGDINVLKSFDFIGFITFGLFLGTLLVALTKGEEKGWSSSYILNLFAVSYFSFWAFIITEFTVKKPIIDLSIFRNYNFVILNILGITRSIALFGTVFLLPLFFQNLMGYSATMTGILLIPQAVMVSIGMPVAGKVVDRIGPKYPLIFGLLLTSFSLYYFHSLSLLSDYTFIAEGLMMRGLGISFIMAPVTSAAINSLKPEEINLGSGMLNVIMQTGGTFGIAMLGTILDIRTDFHMATYTGHLLPSSPITRVSLHRVSEYAVLKGASFYTAAIAGRGGFMAYLHQWATVNAFDDAFMVTGIIVLAGIIPALMFRNIIYKKKRPSKEDIEVMEM
ncbi:MAG: DHA2 family efflux MFS transporter permease subunit [Deltaproteobacteria bacterium]|nr:DHA2 family efflux MFS transporter permease subunit [Deltaproteobacteria bacterium]MCL5276319.1 DHA2 family efflux MFS transporter permease subunit [Deltaproteobacteria bacterium]